MGTIIKGCFYADGDQIMQAHFSGDFWAVDGTDYCKWDDFVSQFNRHPDDDDFTYEYGGEAYYNTGNHSSHHTKNLTLISDISNLFFESDY